MESKTIVVSYTKLNTSCPLKYLFQRKSFLGLETFSYPFTLGRLTHYMLEEYFKIIVEKGKFSFFEKTLYKNLLQNKNKAWFITKFYLIESFQDSAYFDDNFLNLIKNSESFEEFQRNFMDFETSFYLEEDKKAIVEFVEDFYRTFDSKTFEILAKHSLKLFKKAQNKFWKGILKDFNEIYSQLHKRKFKLEQFLKEGGILTPEKRYSIKVDLSDLERIFPSVYIPPFDKGSYQAIKFVGYADLFVKKDDVIYIVDWKTGKLKNANITQLWFYLFLEVLNEYLNATEENQSFENFAKEYLRGKVIKLALVGLREDSGDDVVMTLDFSNEQFEKFFEEFLTFIEKTIFQIYRTTIYDEILEKIETKLSPWKVLKLYKIVNEYRDLIFEKVNQENSSAILSGRISGNFRIIEKIFSILKMAKDKVDSETFQKDLERIKNSIVKVYTVWRSDVEKNKKKGFCKFCNYNVFCPIGITESSLIRSGND